MDQGNTPNQQPDQLASPAKNTDRPPSPNRSKRKALVFMSICGVIILICGIILAYSIGKANTADTPSATTKARAGSSAAPSKAASSQADQYAPLVTDAESLAYLKDLTRADEKDPMAEGKLSAPVTILQFSDMSCPLCSHFETAIRPGLQTEIDNGTIRIEYHHLLIFDEQWKSSLGAKASYAAGKQGKFWEYVKASAEYGQKQAGNGGDSHIQWTEAIAQEIAKTSGVANLAQFRQDMLAPETAEFVDKDNKMSQLAGFSGTPSFIIGHRPLTGAQPVEVFKTVIAAAKED